MKKAGLKRFSNHIFLKRLGRDLLGKFLGYFAVAGEMELMGRIGQTGQNSELDVYSELAAFFLRPERLPPGMVEELLAIEEMSTPDGLGRLQRAVEWARLEPQLRPDSTLEDIAMQVWLLAPEVLAREHNLLRFR